MLKLRLDVVLYWGLTLGLSLGLSLDLGLGLGLDRWLSLREKIFIHFFPKNAIFDKNPFKGQCRVPTILC
jgi:hypothetical protein